MRKVPFVCLAAIVLAACGPKASDPAAVVPTDTVATQATTAPDPYGDPQALPTDPQGDPALDPGTEPVDAASADPAASDATPKPSASPSASPSPSPSPTPTPSPTPSPTPTPTPQPTTAILDLTATIVKKSHNVALFQKFTCDVEVKNPSGVRRTGKVVATFTHNGTPEDGSVPISELIDLAAGATKTITFTDSAFHPLSEDVYLKVTTDPL